MSAIIVDPFNAFATPAQKEDDSLHIERNVCPHCHSLNVKIHHVYQTQNNGERTLHQCGDCDEYFSETYGSPIAGLKTPISEVARVLNARTEGIGVNAAVRVFGYAKNTILSWERRLAGLQQTLFLYSLIYDFLQLIFEGDELYTKVKKNKAPHESEGWTIVMIERASRYIRILDCGLKQQQLFMSAVEHLYVFLIRVKPWRYSQMESVVIANYCLIFAMRCFEVETLVVPKK
ncbi:MAG: hypothetical protein AAGD25_40420 [Cyanobacteria bacterium P01_F01_bin.150]